MTYSNKYNSTNISTTPFNWLISRFQIDVQIDKEKSNYNKDYLCKLSERNKEVKKEWSHFAAAFIFFDFILLYLISHHNYHFHLDIAGISISKLQLAPLLALLLSSVFYFTHVMRWFDLQFIYESARIIMKNEHPKLDCEFALNAYIDQYLYTRIFFWNNDELKPSLTYTVLTRIVMFGLLLLLLLLYSYHFVAIITGYFYINEHLHLSESQLYKYLALLCTIVNALGLLGFIIGYIWQFKFQVASPKSNK